jgi:hypothetical protein
MPARVYVKLLSWHVVQRYDDDGSFRLRCGVIAGPGHPVADSFPVGEKTCESCAAYSLRDEAIEARFDELKTEKPDGDG